MGIQSESAIETSCHLWLLPAAAMLLSAVFLFRRNLDRKSRSDHRSPLPAGSMGWPLIGETFQFVSCAYTDHPESFIDKRRRLYGDLFRSHIFGNPTIVSTDAEVSKFVLQSDSEAFVPYIPRSLREMMGESSILLINGGLQRRVHKLTASFLKSPFLRSKITRDMQQQLHQSMENWNEDQPVYIQDQARCVSFQALVKALIGLDPGEEMEFLKRQYRVFISGLASLPVKLPGSRLPRSLRAKKMMVELVQEIVRARRRRRTVSDSVANPGDLLDVLLAEDAIPGMGDDLIAGNLIDFMIPGEDSVPGLIALAVKYLSDCPAALRQLRAENMELKRRKDRLSEPLVFADFLLLRFTQNVITETLRLGNVVGGVLRTAMRDTEIKGYLIPKGWCVFLCFRSVHLDGNLYDRPRSFDPWRVRRAVGGAVTSVHSEGDEGCAQGWIWPGWRLPSSFTTSSLDSGGWRKWTL